MKKKRALQTVASLLALNTVDHIEAAVENPNLQENTISAGNRNREVAEALEILPEYWQKLAVHYPQKDN